ncbi:ABC transporter ATP-binding protein [Streptomyces phaeofaciens]|uniref:ABC transporter ATP-binding protein n=1 Tax=Streptomyces phaeofaciens TaxID=68254 RepID=UPI003676AEE6
MATDVHRPVAPAARAPQVPQVPQATKASPAVRVPQAVRVEGLTRSFDGRPVIDGLRLEIRPGEFVALLGRSGCGKTALLRILAGLDRDIEGTVLVPRRRAVAFQAPRPTAWTRVWRTVLLGLPGRPGRTVARPKTLSGGEAQRASPARAPARRPDLLLLDEPFGAPDAVTRVKARRLVGELWRRHGCAVLLVTHDVEQAVLLADRVLVMDGGVIAYEERIGLDRPRDITDPRFAELRAGLQERLGDSRSTAHPS